MPNRDWTGRRRPAARDDGAERLEVRPRLLEVRIGRRAHRVGERDRVADGEHERRLQVVEDARRVVVERRVAELGLRIERGRCGLLAVGGDDPALAAGEHDRLRRARRREAERGLGARDLDRLGPRAGLLADQADELAERRPRASASSVDCITSAPSMSASRLAAHEHARVADPGEDVVLQVQAGLLLDLRGHRGAAEGAGEGVEHRLGRLAELRRRERRPCVARQVAEQLAAAARVELRQLAEGPLGHAGEDACRATSRRRRPGTSRSSARACRAGAGT